MHRSLSNLSSCFAKLPVLLGFGVLALGLSGCPSGMCLVKVCKGDSSNCRCSWDTCPSGSYFDTQRDACVCEMGRVSLNSSCMTQAEANAYCGAGARYEGYGCVRIVCPPGQELDLTTGACLAKQQVDKVAENMGVQVGEGQKLGCPPGLVLIVENAQSASCVPPENTCSRDETWNGQACVKVLQCSPGWILDTASGQCVAVSTNETDYTVDLQAWTSASYGTPGGPGTPAFCSGFNKKPRTFGVGPGATVHVLIDVQVQAPGRSVVQAQVATSGRMQAGGAPVTQQGAAEIQRTAQELLASLRVQGGKTASDAGQTSVRCTIVNAAQPAPVPESGGL
ncbi:MAG: hypothetical protein CVU63_05165 [Deltaproteobacteria bacterium HGW-Deltaproteobacteria-20]|nr:MAG: hypothetical protein CVU63_05165 [Deltaproteobacteria bacterium HGW-Deltaproteobacteria-20]